MNKAITINNLAKLEHLTAVAPYTSDPTELFHALCEKNRTACYSNLLKSIQKKTCKVYWSLMQRFV